MFSSANNIRVTAIIQARIDSTRLPSKALLPLGGKPMIWHVIERSKAIEGVDSVVLATGDHPVNQPLSEIAESCGIKIFFGSEKNVLERYYLAAEKFGGDFIIRVTGDNPFTDPSYASLTLKKIILENADICSPLGLPLGTAVEVIKRSALISCYQNSSLAHHFEHVTPYIKENPDTYNIVRFSTDMPDKAETLRLTIDTPEDYQLAMFIHQNLETDKNPSLLELIKLLLSNPDSVVINRHIKQREMNHSG